MNNQKCLPAECKPVAKFVEDRFNGLGTVEFIPHNGPPLQDGAELFTTKQPCPSCTSRANGSSVLVPSAELEKLQARCVELESDFVVLSRQIINQNTTIDETEEHLTRAEVVIDTASQALGDIANHHHKSDWVGDWAKEAITAIKEYQEGKK